MQVIVTRIAGLNLCRQAVDNSATAVTGMSGRGASVRGETPGQVEGETLMHTLVQLGKSLSIETLAEGIEQTAELSLLQSEQCDSGQGFLLARPLDAAATEALLSTWVARQAPEATPVL